MKKSILAILIFIFGIQFINATNPIKYGIVGGVNFSKYVNADLGYKAGVSVGGQAEMRLPVFNNKLFVSAAGLLSAKGGQEKEFSNISIRAYYFQIPIQIGFKHGNNKKVSFFESFGPYIGYGIAGKTIIDEHTEGLWGNYEKVPAQEYETFSSTTLDRFDAGLGGKIGLDIKQKYQLSLGVDCGLVKIMKGNDCKNFNFSLSIAYFL